MSDEYLKDRIINESTDYRTDSLVRALSEFNVFTTKEFSIPGKKIDYQNGIIIGPNMAGQLIALLFFSSMAAFIAGTILKQLVSYWVLWLGFLMIGYLIYRNIKFFHRAITIDSEGIDIWGNRYQWQNMQQTFILNQDGARISKSWLVIIDKHGNIYKDQVSRSYLSVSMHMLATLIEYYKTKDSSSN